MHHWFVLFFIFNGFLYAQNRPLIKAHAHNDYLHERPLHSALDAGFTSIEVDLVLEGDSLFVAHEPETIKRGYTFESVYLKPLKKRLKSQAGKLYSQPHLLTLLVDFKSNPARSYNRFKEIIKPYHGLLTSYTDSTVTERLVRIVISGNRPFDEVRADAMRYVTIDGRLDDLDKPFPATLIWLVSANARTTFSDGLLALQTDKILLEKLVRKVHKAGKKIRFWATYDAADAYRDNLWKALLKYDVDLINTDDINGLKHFLYKNY